MLTIDRLAEEAGRDIEVLMIDRLAEEVGCNIEVLTKQAEGMEAMMEFKLRLDEYCSDFLDMRKEL